MVWYFRILICFLIFGDENITDAPIHVQKRNKEEVYSEARELLKRWDLKIKKTPIHTSFPAVSARGLLSQEPWP